MNSYAGIGSRYIPFEISCWMNEIGSYMAKWDWVLRSGGAKGSDTEFEKGCGNGPKEIYLPWPGFNGHESTLSTISTSAYRIASKVWNSRFTDNNVQVPWERLKAYTKNFMARNCYQILGPGLNDPVKLVICWTKDGGETGGTGQALRLARMINNGGKYNNNIVIINLQKEAHRKTIRNIMKTNTDPITIWNQNFFGGNNARNQE